MTRPARKPADAAEKRQLDEALEEGLEETFRPPTPSMDPAAALEGGSPRQTGK